MRRHRIDGSMACCADFTSKPLLALIDLDKSVSEPFSLAW